MDGRASVFKHRPQGAALRAGGDAGLEELSGVAGGVGDELLRRAFGDDAAAGVAAFGAQVDYLVGGLDEVEVVLDDHGGVAAIDQVVEQRPVSHIGEIGNVEEPPWETPDRCIRR